MAVNNEEDLALCVMNEGLEELDEHRSDHPALHTPEAEIPAATDCRDERRSAGALPDDIGQHLRVNPACGVESFLFADEVADGGIEFGAEKPYLKIAGIPKAFPEKAAEAPGGDALLDSNHSVMLRHESPHRLA